MMLALVNFFIFVLKKSKNLSKKNTKLEKILILKKNEELYLYRLSTRILSFLAYFYNNPSISIEKMIERIDTTIRVSN